MVRVHALPPVHVEVENAVACAFDAQLLAELSAFTSECVVIK